MKNIKRITNHLFGLTLLLTSSLVAAELVIITNKSTQEKRLTKNTLADMYLDKVKTYPDGTRVRAVDQAPGSDARKTFYQAILGKSETQVNRYWAKRRYSGKGKPPMVISGDEAVKNWIANNPGAIGYIDKKNLDNSVKALLTIR